MFVLAQSSARSLLGPLLDTVCDRLVFILRNLYKLAAERMRIQQFSRGRWNLFLCYFWISDDAVCDIILHYFSSFESLIMLRVRQLLKQRIDEWIALMHR